MNLKKGIGLLMLVCSTHAVAIDLGLRQHIYIVGSSTAYPIISAAAEWFGRNTRFRAPVLESTGTGGGFKMFCSGLGLDTPDIVMASRPMKTTELRRCEEQGVGEIVALQIGFDGIVLAHSRQMPRLEVSAEDLYLALAKEVPDPSGRTRLISNPYQRWHEINPLLPDLSIRVLGPPPTSGTRDILVERLFDSACAKVQYLRTMRQEEEVAFRRSCIALREDGVYINAGESDARLVRRLIDDPQVLGILGFNFLDRNSDKLNGAVIDGVEPRFELIESGEYPLSRPLWLYLKEAHVQTVAGLSEFVVNLTSPEAWGDEGYLVDKGLIPLPEGERKAQRENAGIGTSAPAVSRGF